MAKTATFKLRMKNGMVREVSGTIINDRWGIDKRDDKFFYLTYIPQGALVTSARTQKALKELVSRPDMIDEDDPVKIAKAVGNFWGSRDWKG